MYRTGYRGQVQVGSESEDLVKLLDVNWNPTNRQLMQFGLISLIALPFIGWLWGGWEIAIWCAAVGGVLALVGLIFPRALKPVFLGLTLVALPIGMVIGELAMIIIYFAVFLPIGIFFHVSRRDRLQLRTDRSNDSYWQRKRQPTGPASYYRQS